MFILAHLVHQIIDLLLKLSFLLVRCAILPSFIVDHVFELIELLAELVADFTDIAPRIRHLVELVEVWHVDARELSMHPVRVIRRLYHLFTLTASSGLSLICWVVGCARQWSGHLGSIRRQNVRRLVNGPICVRLLGYVGHGEGCLLLLLRFRGVDVAGLGQGSGRMIGLHRALAAALI